MTNAADIWWYSGLEADLVHLASRLAVHDKVLLQLHGLMQSEAFRDSTVRQFVDCWREDRKHDLAMLMVHLTGGADLTWEGGELDAAAYRSIVEQLSEHPGLLEEGSAHGEVESYTEMEPLLSLLEPLAEDAPATPVCEAYQQLRRDAGDIRSQLLALTRRLPAE